MGHLKLPIKGMHCRSCELALEDKIKDVKRVSSVKVSYASGVADISYHDSAPSAEELAGAVKEAGYEVGTRERGAWFSRKASDYRELLVAGIILAVLYVLARASGILDISTDISQAAYSFAFVIGLIAGVSTCMAVVGGLVLGISARHAEAHPEAAAWQKFRPHLYFGLGRIGGYALLGGLLGTLGSFVKISGLFQAALTLAIGVVMVMLGIKLIGISPRLKDANFTLPSSISKRLGLNRHRKEYSPRAAAFTGALTFFLPCGFTQAMQLAAVGTGSFAGGAVIMGLFALGTAPALLSIGGLTSVIKGKIARRFYSVVGLAVLIFGISNAGNALSLMGVGLPEAKSGRPADAAEVVDGYQVVRMTQKSGGYSPNKFTVVAGVPVKWMITSETAYSCAASIVIPSMGIRKNLAA
jgi:uncharacterized protein